MSPDAPPTELGPGLLSEQVHRRLRADIVAGALAPGERLLESEVARRFGVSQAPVREAIRQLAHEGLVDSVPRRGSTVAQVSAEDAARARRLRVALEALAAREAVAAWDEEAAARVERVVQEMAAAATAADPVAFRAHDLTFHRTVVELGGNAFLRRAWTQLESTLYVLQVIGDPFAVGDLGAAVGWHAALLDVLRAGDADAAAEAFTRHADGRVGPG